MKRFIWITIIFVFAAVVCLLVNSSIRQAVQIGHIHPDEECMTEYSRSKELYIFIDLTERTLYLFKDGKQIRNYSVAIGTKKNPSPIGVFKIVEKGYWGKSFGGRWMGLNVPWGTYGIHGTTKPDSIGRAASHGCIRMRNKDAAELYKLVKKGTVVEIYGGPFGPFGKGFRVLHPGDAGADVLEVQKRLRIKGYYKGYLSGFYGIDMEKALNRFQKAKKLPISNVIDIKMYKKLGIILEE
ncbi:MAG TPA: L,D-transpeptidase family protein [Clostridia bacterium]|nr:L,D-transpeptidase family protein [Clostridia bacterium]